MTYEDSHQQSCGILVVPPTPSKDIFPLRLDVPGAPWDFLLWRSLELLISRLGICLLSGLLMANKGHSVRRSWASGLQVLQREKKGAERSIREPPN